MTRGEMRIMGQLIQAGGEWLSVGVIHMILGYSRKFVERTVLKLYWDPPKGMRIFRMYDNEREDWYYRYYAKDGIE